LFGEQKWNKMKSKTALLFLLILPFAAFAQKEDFQLWGSVKFSKKVNSKVRFELQEQIRWNDSLSQQQKNFTDLGFRYKITKAHYLGLNVRIVNEFEEDKNIRMNLDFISEYSPSGTSISLKQRIRLQQSWKDDGEIDNMHFRTKWAIALKNKFINPYFSHEIYWKMAAINELSKKRSTLGFSWDMMKKLKMKMFVRSQREQNKNNPDHLKILGFGLQYKI